MNLTSVSSRPAPDLLLVAIESPRRAPPVTPVAATELDGTATTWRETWATNGDSGHTVIGAVGTGALADTL